MRDKIYGAWVYVTAGLILAGIATFFIGLFGMVWSDEPLFWLRIAGTGIVGEGLTLVQYGLFKREKSPATMKMATNTIKGRVKPSTQAEKTPIALFRYSLRPGGVRQLQQAWRIESAAGKGVQWEDIPEVAE